MFDWIACDDRMPDPRTNVLLCQVAEDGEAAWAIACLCQNDVGEPYWLTTSGPCQIRRFTHWRALPELPDREPSRCRVRWADFAPADGADLGRCIREYGHKGPCGFA